MIRHDEWRSGELQVIYDLVNKPDWFDTARQLLPGRSEGAIRTKMSGLRAEAGIVPQHIGPSATSTRNAVRDRAREGSKRLLQAIRDAAA